MADPRLTPGAEPAAGGDVLRGWATGGGPMAVRAQVVLLAEEGVRDAEIARRLGISRQTVGTWRHRWQSAGLPGLEQRPRTGRPATVDEAEVVTRALLAPGGSGAGRAIARELGLSHATVAGIRRRWRLTADAGPGPFVPTVPPLPGTDVWVLGLYADARRAVLLAGTRQSAAAAAGPAATVIGEDVLAGLGRALDALRPAAGRPAARDPAPDGLAGFLSAAAEHHPDIALHAVTLWNDSGRSPAPGPAGGPSVHLLPAKSSWRGFLRAMVALDSTSHPESSRRVYLDLIAALQQADGAVGWLRESVAGHLWSARRAVPEGAPRARHRVRRRRAG